MENYYDTPIMDSYYGHGNIIDSYYEEETFEEITDDVLGSDIDLIKIKSLQVEEIAKQRILQELQTEELKELYEQQSSELKSMLEEEKLKLSKLLEQSTLDLEEKDWIQKEQTLDRLTTLCKKRICYLEERISEMEEKIADLEERAFMHHQQTLELKRLHEKEINDLHIQKWMEDQTLELKKMHQREICSMHDRKWKRHHHVYESNY